MKQPEQLTYRELAKYTEGEVTASEAEEMDTVLFKAPESRQRLSRVRKVIDHLGDTAAVNEIDLLPGLKERLTETYPIPALCRRRRVSPRTIGLAAAAVVAFMLPLILLMKSADAPRRGEDGFRAKSATKSADPRSRWIALNVFRLSGNADPVQIEDTLHVEDGLLFSYTNLGPDPFSHLMIFAVDPKQQVYWYYPAFLDERDDPKGIAIEKGVSRAGLHEVIAHPYREGVLTIFGLFSDNALTVSDVETAVRQGTEDGSGFEAAFDGVRVKTLKVKVLK